MMQASRSEEWIKTMCLLFLQDCDEGLVETLMDMEKACLSLKEWLTRP